MPNRLVASCVVLSLSACAEGALEPSVTLSAISTAEPLQARDFVWSYVEFPEARCRDGSHAGISLSLNSSAVMVGDRKHDMLAARANGIRGLGVLYGFGDAAELTEPGAALTCKHVADIPPAIACMFSA